MQQVVLLGGEDVAFRVCRGILKQPAQFVIVRHQLIERKKVCRSVCRLAAHAPAAVSGHGVKPDGHLLRGPILARCLMERESTSCMVSSASSGWPQTFMLNE